MTLSQHLPRSARVSAIGILVLLGFVSVGTSAEVHEYSQEYSRNFQSDGFDNRSLALIGKGATSLIQQTEEGVLISVPAGPKVKSVGFAPRFVIQGDFEITVGYEIKAWDRPKEGYWIGPTLYISTEGEGDPAAELGRLHTAGDKDVHSTFARAFIDGSRQKSVRKFPAKTMRGQLRMRRQGDALSFEVRGDWLDEPFKVLRTTDFNTEDIRLVRVAIKRNDHAAGIRAVLHSLRIRADELPQLPSEQAASEQLYRPMYHPPPRRSSWVWATAFTTGAVLVMLGGVAWFIRRRRY